MKNIKLKQILVWSMLLFTGKAIAQTSGIFIENDSIVFKDYTDSVFMNVDLSMMETNILTNRAYTFIEPWMYEGDNDTTTANSFQFHRLYGSFHQFDTLAFPNIFNFDSIKQSIHSSNMVGINFLMLDYERLYPNAIAEGLLTTDSTGKFLKNINGINTPIEKNTVFAISPTVQVLDTFDVLFVFPEELIFTDENYSINSIDIDFDNGQGWQTVYKNTTLLVHFDSIYENKTFKYRYNNGNETYITKTNIRFSQRIKNIRREYTNAENGPDGEVWFNFTATEKFEGKYGSAKVTIAYGCGNNKILKPLIIVPGIDYPEFAAYRTPVTTHPADDQGWGYETYLGFLDIIKKNTKGAKLIEDLEREGYDLIYIDYHHGADYIQRNAKVVQAVIREVNARKVANGSIEPTEILSFSMGGVVARYALCEMESNNESHDVETYTSYDAPHNGANFPMGYQFMVEHYTELVINLKILHVPLYGVPLSLYVKELNDIRDVLHAPATHQLLKYHVSKYLNTNTWETVGSHDDRNTLQTQLDNWGFPSQQSARGVTIKNRLISNGAINASNQGFNANEKLLDIDKVYGIRFIPIMAPFVPHTVIPGVSASIIQIPIGGYFAGFTVDHEVFAMPSSQTAGTEVQVYKGNINPFIIKGLAYFHDNNKANIKIITDDYDIDNAPGGQFPLNFKTQLDKAKTSGLIPSQYQSKMSIYHGNMCFIPTVSALGLKSPYRDNIYYNVQNNWNTSTNTWNNNESEVKNWTSSIENGSPINTNHVDFRSQYADYLTNVYIPSIILNQPFLNNRSFNYGASTSHRIESVTIENSGKLLINKDANIGYSDNPPSPVIYPTQGSEFKVVTGGMHCDAVDIDVKAQGEIIIGDNTTNNIGSLIVSGNATLNVKNGGKIIVNEGSSLIIQNGGVLTLFNNSTLEVKNNAKVIVETGGKILYVSGANIILEGTDAMLEIGGILELESGANFTFTKGVSAIGGYIKFNNATITPLALATINLSGLDKYDKLMEVVGTLNIEGVASNKISLFTLDKGTIEMGNNAQVVCNGKVYIDDVLFKEVNGANEPKGLKINAQSGMHLYNSNFEGLKEGLEINNPNNYTSFTLDRCRFSGNEVGLVCDDINKIKNCRFFYNTSGANIYAGENITIENTRFVNNDEGVIMSDDKDVYFYNCHFRGNDLGIESIGNATTTLKCCLFYLNDIATECKDDINISSTHTINGHTGGDNTFYENVKGIHLNPNPSYNNSDIYLDNGNNNFIGGTAPYNFIYGSYSTTTSINANNNYWEPVPTSINTAGVNYYNITTILNYHVTNVQLTGTLLSGYNSTCVPRPSNQYGFNDGDYNDLVYNPQSETNVEDILNIYPNPANDFIKFGYNKKQIKRVVLYSLEGKIIIDKTVHFHKGIIKTNDIKEGIYLLKVVSAGETEISKIVISR